MVKSGEKLEKLGKSREKWKNMVKSREKLGKVGKSDEKFKKVVKSEKKSEEKWLK